MKSEVQRLHTVEQTYRLSTDRITELERIIAQLMKDLEQEKLEKELAINEKEALKKESDLVGRVLCLIHIECLCRNASSLSLFICFAVISSDVQISNQILHAKSQIFKHQSQSQVFKNTQIPNLLTLKSQILVKSRIGL